MAVKKKAAAKAAPKRTTAARRTAAKKYTPAKKSSTSRTAPGRTAKKSAPKKKSYSWRDSAKKMAKNYKGKTGGSKGKPAKGKGGKKKNIFDFPSIEEYLMSDEYYQYGLSDLEWALEQFMEENAAAEGDVGASFGSAMGYMNLDKEKAHEYMKDDYGARGLVFSGLYPKAVSDYNEEWSMGAADLNRDLASQMRDLGFEEENMRQQTEMQKRDLRLDAIRRRAEELQQAQFTNQMSQIGKSVKKTAKAAQGAKKAASKRTPAKRKTGTRKTGTRRTRKR